MLKYALIALGFVAVAATYEADTNRLTVDASDRVRKDSHFNQVDDLFYKCQKFCRTQTIGVMMGQTCEEQESLKPGPYYEEPSLEKVCLENARLHKAIQNKAWDASKAESRVENAKAAREVLNEARRQGLQP